VPFILFIVNPENFKVKSVKAVQAVFGGEPHETF
jgi:hypothetical protein